MDNNLENIRTDLVKHLEKTMCRIKLYTHKEVTRIIQRYCSSNNLSLKADNLFYEMEKAGMIHKYFLLTETYYGLERGKKID